MATITITANGDYALDAALNPSTTVVYVSGLMGAATAIFTYENEAGTNLPLTDGAVAIGEQYQITSGSNKEIFMTVTGADGSTSIEVESAGVC